MVGTEFMRLWELKIGKNAGIKNANIKNAKKHKDKSHIFVIFYAKHVCHENSVEIEHWNIYIYVMEEEM